MTSWSSAFEISQQKFNLKTINQTNLTKQSVEPNYNETESKKTHSQSSDDKQSILSMKAEIGQDEAQKKPCYHWVNEGYCVYESSCAFMHSEELKGLQSQTNEVKMKNRPCYHWTNNGRCAYAQKCGFLHGEEALKDLVEQGVAESKTPLVKW